MLLASHAETGSAGQPAREKTDHMTTYQIVSEKNGNSLGEYAAASSDEAMALLAERGGYTSYEIAKSEEQDDTTVLYVRRIAPTKITITMTDRAPVTIAKADWPLIARADWHSGKHEREANQVATMRVREHRDGRRLVYGTHGDGPGGMPIGWRGSEAGFLVTPTGEAMRQPTDGGALVSGQPDGTETVRAIRRVAGLIDMGELGNALIADLPAEELL